MKKIFFVCITLIMCLSSCSKDDDDNGSELPIAGLQLPSSSSENPFKAGATVTIQGTGFNSSSEIWLRATPATKNEGDVKAKITEVTAGSISFEVPEGVSGEKDLILKQDGKEQSLGSLVFTDTKLVKKRITKQTFSYSDENREKYEFVYDEATGRLKTMKTQWDDYKFKYDDTGRLISETVTWDTESTSTRRFTYETGKITVKEADDDESEIILTLNNKGQVTHQKETYIYDGETDIYNTDYEYDVLGNVTKVTEGYTEGNNEVTTEITTYEYDSKISCLAYAGLPAWYWIYFFDYYHTGYIGSNNVIKITGKDKENGNPYEEQWSYTYDEDGYPTEVTVGTDGEEITYTYEIIE
jgi:YD repeat-containing protein